MRVDLEVDIILHMLRILSLTNGYKLIYFFKIISQGMNIMIQKLHK